MKKNENSCCHSHAEQPHVSITGELLCHFPYAVLAVALALMVMSIISTGSPTHSGLHALFHTTHFLHLLFASSGAVIVARRFGASVLLTLGLSTIVPAFFCTVSDAIMPYLGGKLVGLHMHFHWCFVSHITTVLPFLIVGIIGGFVMSSHDAHRQAMYASFSHFSHIFISALASTSYLISHGFASWASQMGFVFSYLLVAVLIPCTLADVIIPMLLTIKRRAQ